MAGLVSVCRACGGRLSATMADLGLQPPSNAFLASLAEARNEKRYPLRAKVCGTCKLVQVDYDVAPEELFGNYVYFSSYSDEWLAHAKRYAAMARERFGLGADSLVVELASNDGYLLKNFVDSHRIHLAAVIVAGLDGVLEVAARGLCGQIVGDDVAGAALVLDPGEVGHGDPNWLAIDGKADVRGIGVARGDGDDGSLPAAMEFFAGPAVGHFEIFIHD